MATLPSVTTGGLLAALSHRLRAALPGWKPAAAGALLWSAAMAASALLSMQLDAWETPGKIAEVVALFALGAAFAFPSGLYVARFIALGRQPETAFAAAFLSLSLATIGLTAGLYALQYRGYYAQWHADAFSVTWIFQLVFTTLSSLYQFAVLGVRMYMPVGFAALVLGSLWFARQPR